LLQFGKNNQKINYLNAGFSEVHRFQYAGGDEKLSCRGQVTGFCCPPFFYLPFMA